MKLEIGPGPSKISREWITVGDFTREGVVDHVCMWGEDIFPFDDGVFDLVYASHCLEHVPWYKVDDAIREVYRLLKDDGVFEVHVPDFGYLLKCYNDKNLGDNWNKFNNQENYVKWFSSRLFSYGPTLSNYHKSCFDEEYLKHCLLSAGFKTVEKIGDSLASRLHGRINLGMRAVK